jgi:hypothetical protein
VINYLVPIGCTLLEKLVRLSIDGTLMTFWAILQLIRHEERGGRETAVCGLVFPELNLAKAPHTSVILVCR